MKVKEDNNEAEQNLSVAGSSRVIQKQKKLIDNKKLKNIVFPNISKKQDNETIENIVFRKQDTFADELLIFQDYKRQEKFCDITLLVGDVKFNAHRIVLAAMIPYFNIMFKSNMMESNMKEIALAGFDAELIEMLINFAYGVEISINEDNAESIMMAASFFQLDRVVDLCAQFFIPNFDVSNVLQYYFISDKINCQKMKNEALKHMCLYFSEIVEHDQFLELSYDTIKKIASSNNLNINSESRVFEAIIKWVKYNQEDRAQYLPDLLDSVRLILLQAEYIVTVVANEELVANSPECRSLVEEIKNCFLVPAKKNAIEQSKLLPRLCSLEKNLYAIQFETNVRTVFIYNSEKHIWEGSKTENDEFEFVYDVAFARTVLYTANPRLGLTTIEAYDFVMKTWKTITPMLSKRIFVGIAVLNDFLYVCGGHHRSQPTKTVQRYCPTTKKWMLLCEMKVVRSNPIVVACKEYLYVISNSNEVHRNNQTVHLMEKYNPSTGEWTTQPSLTIKKQDIQASNLNGKIYVIGRNANPRTTENQYMINTMNVYDPENELWTPVASFDYHGKILSFFPYKEKFIVIHNNYGRKLAAMYDPMTDKWSVDISIPDIDAFCFGTNY